VLRAARPTPLRFEFEGPILLTVDGARIGTDIQRGRWGNAALAPGDHLLTARFTLKKKSETLFKVSCETADTCLPGDLLVLPAEEVLHHSACRLLTRVPPFELRQVLAHQRSRRVSSHGVTFQKSAVEIPLTAACCPGLTQNTALEQDVAGGRIGETNSATLTAETQHS
jgi:hypothetical protein